MGSETRYYGTNGFGSERQLIRYSGINFLLRVRGHVAQFSMVYFIKSMAVFLVVLQMSVHFTSKVVLKVYKMVPGLSHLPGMYKYFRYSESLDHLHVKEHGLKGLEEHQKLQKERIHMSFLSTAQIDSSDSEETAMQPKSRSGFELM